MANRANAYTAVVAVLQFASMAILIIACVTAPVFKQIGLSSYNDYRYGVFGICNDSEGSCTKASINYSPYSYQDMDNAQDHWGLKSSTARKLLGKMLLVVPVSAGITFISLIFNVLHTFVLPASMAAFVSALCVNLLAFIGSAFSCIVVFLLFYPSVNWCAWILIPAGVFNLVSLPLVFLIYINKTYYNDDREMDRDDDDNDNDRYGSDTDGFGSYSRGRENLLEKEDTMTDKEDINITNLSYKDDDFFNVGIPKAYQTSKNSYSESQNNSSTVLGVQSNTSNKNYLSQDTFFTKPVVADEATDGSDLSLNENQQKQQPFSAVQNTKRNSAVLTPTSANFSNVNTNTREFSDSSSKYSEMPNGYTGSGAKPYPGSTIRQPQLSHLNNVTNHSRTDTLVTADLKPNSVLLLNDNNKNKMNTTSGTIDEEDEEFFRKNTIDPSERPEIDDDGISELGSTFTSVSQRGVNPEYYKKNQQTTPQTAAPQQQQPQQQPPQNFVPQQNAMNQRMQAPMQNPMMQQQPYYGNQPQQQMYGYNQGYAPQQQQQMRFNNNNNAYYNGAQGMSGDRRFPQQQFMPQQQPQFNRPGYKKRLPNNNKFTPQSIQNSNIYNFR